MCSEKILNICYESLYTGTMCKVIYVSPDGKHSESCGSLAMPCRTIGYAVESMSNDRDTIFVTGTQNGDQALYNEENIVVDKEIYIKGVNGKPAILCGMNVVTFKVKSANVSFTNFEFQGIQSSLEKTKVTTIAIDVNDASISVEDCNFRAVPVAITFNCKTECTCNITKTEFKGSFKAIIIEGEGTFKVNLRRSTFVGKPSFSYHALLFSSFGSNKTTKYFHLAVQRCVFQYFSSSIRLYFYNTRDFSMEVRNTAFSHNHFVLQRNYVKHNHGSAISFERMLFPKRGYKVRLFISNSTFVNNTSIIGGAIYIGSADKANLTINTSMFLSNKALDSGGAVFCVGYVEIRITRSTFKSNICKPPKEILPPNVRGPSPRGIGGALHFESFHTLAQAVILDSIFKNNSADFMGGSIYANQKLVMSHVTLKTSRHQKDTSYVATLVSSIKSCSLENVTFGVRNAIDSRVIAFFSGGRHALKLDRQSTFICQKGSLMKEKSFPIDKEWFQLFTFHCGLCPPDFYSLRHSIFTNGTKNNAKCLRCPSGGRCRSGLLKAKDNFWGYEDDKWGIVKFIALPIGYGCSGSQCVTHNVCAPNRQGKLCGACKNGYSESAFSAKCISNEQCKESKFWLISSFSLLLFLIFFFYKQVIINFVKSQFKVIKKKNLQRDIDEDTQVGLITDDGYMASNAYLQRNAQAEGHKNTVDNCFHHETHNSDIATGLIKVMFYFYQTEYILRSYSSDVGNHIFLRLRHVVGSLFNFEFSSGHDGSFSCALYGMTPITKIALRMSLVAMVFVILISMLAFTNVYQRIRGRLRYQAVTIQSAARTTRFGDKVTWMIFEIALLSYGVITKAVFALLTCSKVGNKQFLFIQGNIQCYKPWQYALMGVGFCWVIPFCLFVILLPGLLRGRNITKKGIFFGLSFPLLFLFYFFVATCVSKQQQRQHNLAQTDYWINGILKILAGPFKTTRKHHIRWEGVYLVRRLILLSVNAFVEDQISKLYTLLLIQVLFLLHHVYMRPFKSKLLNSLEATSLTALIMINCVKTFAAYDYEHGFREEAAGLYLFKAFAWTELAIVLCGPIVIGLAIAVLVMARILLVSLELVAYVYRKAGLGCKT